VLPASSFVLQKCERLPGCMIWPKPSLAHQEAIVQRLLAIFILNAIGGGFGTLIHLQGRPVPPGVRQGEQTINNAPLEPPVHFKRKPEDLAKLKQEADELAKLSAAVPSEVGLIEQGKLPRDFVEQLKRIEKLAKHLRSEISQ
jgi:hypothetical protein